MKVTLKKVLLLAMLMLVLTALFVVGASAATLDGADNADITDDATAVTANAVARVGEDAYYTTFEGAFAKANEAGGTITMLKDIGTAEAPSEISATLTVNTNITVDGNGFKMFVSMPATVYLFTIGTDNVVFTLDDFIVTFKTGGSGNAAIIHVKEPGTVNVNDSFLVSNRFGVHWQTGSQAGGTLNVTNSTIFADSLAFYLTNGKDKWYTVNVTDSTLVSTGYNAIRGDGNSSTINFLRSQITNNGTHEILHGRSSGSDFYYHFKAGTVLGGTYSITLPDGTEKSTTKNPTYGMYSTVSGTRWTLYDDVKFEIDGVVQRGGSAWAFDASYVGDPVYRVASNGYKYVWDSLQGAAAGDTITLYGNLTETEPVTVGAAYTLNLNGKTLTAELIVSAALTISNGTVASEGTAFTLTDAAATVIATSVTVTAAKAVDVSDEVEATGKAAEGVAADSVVTYQVIDPRASVVHSDESANHYATLSEAIAELRDGDVVTLYADASITQTITKAITIKGAFALNSTADVAFAVPENGTLTLENVTLTASGTAFTVANGSKIVLTGVTATAATMLGAGFDDQNNGNSFTTDNFDVAMAIAAIDGYYVADNDGIYTVTTVKPVVVYDASVSIDGSVTNYETFANALADALAAAGEGKTVILTLMRDVDLGTAGITVNAAMTLVGDLSAPKLIYSGEGAAITVSAAGVVVTDLTVDAANASAFALTEGATLTLGSITAGDILTGAVNGNVTVDAALAEVLNNDEGYAITEGYVVRVAVACVGTTNYPSFEAAFAAAAANDTITLLSNVTLTEAITVDKNITVVGNSFTITAEGAAFTLSGSNVITFTGMTVDASKVSGVEASITVDSSVTYGTFAGAFAAANALENGATIQLLGDITLTDLTEVFRVAKPIVIDGKKDEQGGRYKLTVSYSAEADLFGVSAAFTLQNVEIDATFPAGKYVMSTGTGGIDISVINAKIISSHGFLWNSSSPTVLIDGSVIVSKATNAIYTNSTPHFIINNSHVAAGAGNGVFDVHNSNAVIDLKGNTVLSVGVTEYGFPEITTKPSASIRMRGSSNECSPIITLYDTAKLTSGSQSHIYYTENGKRTGFNIRFADNYTGEHAFVKVDNTGLTDNCYMTFYSSLQDVANQYWTVYLAKDVTFSETVFITAGRTYPFETAPIVSAATGELIEKTYTITYTGTEAALVVDGDVATSFNNINFNAPNGTAFSFNGAATSVALTGCAVTAKTVLHGFVDGNAFSTDNQTVANALTAEGYGVSEAEGIYTVTSVPKASIIRTEGAETKTTYYATLDEALAAVVDGDILVLWADATLTDAISAQITIDVNGKVLTVNGTATVTGAEVMMQCAAGTVYGSLLQAITVANAGDGGTITLLTDIDLYRNARIEVSKNLVIDGQNTYQITASSTAQYGLFSLTACSFEIKNITVILDHSSINAEVAVVRANGLTADHTVTITNCHLESDNGAIAIINSGAGTLDITGSTIIGASWAAIDFFQSSTTVNITNSTLITGRDAIIRMRNSGAATINLKDGAVLDGNSIVTRYPDAGYTKAASAFNSEGGTHTLVVAGDVSILADVGAVMNSSTMSFTSDKFEQIVRVIEGNYYFYNYTAELVLQAGDVIYNKAVADAVVAARVYGVTEADGVYTVAGTLDFTAIDGAISGANTAKDGLLTADKACDAGVDNKYVLPVDLQALLEAITAAENAKATAKNNDELAAAVTALNEAVATFTVAIKDGDGHKDENKDHACDYGCDVYQGTHADSDEAGDTDHLCEYCGKIVDGEGCHDDDSNGHCDECGADLAHDCVDEDTNHACDICGTTVSEHVDADKDHACDNGCSEPIGVHEDTNKDHKCDYGCQVPFGDHVDSEEDKDHVCDYGCGETLNDHTGGTPACDKLPVCTVCGLEYGELLPHTPSEDDGDCTTEVVCSVCGAVTTPAEEAHTGGSATCAQKAQCTVCGMAYGELRAHKDENADLLCDYEDCGAALVASVGTSYYASLADAIAATNALEYGGTITLLADITVENLADTLTIAKTVTIDGKKDDQGGKYKITASGTTHLFTAAANFTLQNVDVTYTADTAAQYAIVYALNYTNTINVSNCYLDSNNSGIYINGSTADGKLNITDSSVVIANSSPLVFDSGTCIVTITDSNIVCRGTLNLNESTAVVFRDWNGSTVTITNSTLAAGGGYVIHMIKSGPTIKLMQDALVTKNWDKASEYGITPVNGTAFYGQRSGTSPKIIFDYNAKMVGLNTHDMRFAYSASRAEVYFGEHYTGYILTRGNDGAVPGTTGKTTDYRFYATLAEAIANGYAYVLINRDVVLNDQVLAISKNLNFYKANILDADGNASDFVPTVTYTGAESAFTVNGNFAVTFNNVNVAAANGTAFTLNGASASVALTGVALTASKVFDGYVNGNTFSTDNKDIADAIKTNRIYIVIEESGVYTVTGVLDFVALDGVLADANSAKENVVTADKACVAGAGNKYVTDAEMQALLDAITAAEAIKTTAVAQSEIDDAMLALNEAVSAFRGVLKDGEDHKDEDKDHVCENGCGVTVGKHEDENKDHNCDYGCTETIGECKDEAPKDHRCDYGCGKSFGDHEDLNTDHNCDYGCSEYMGEHKDENTDHNCDYGCDEKIGDHEDVNPKDHVCDYGCDERIGGECADGDADTDHVCDYCGVFVDGEVCHDDDSNGYCDECGADMEHECVDEDKNHACDVCSKDMGDCVDVNRDHLCDYGCGKSNFGEHSDSDTDGDHLCDYCGKEDTVNFKPHVDENKDHVCDNGCSEPIGECKDDDKDHDCDYGCDKFFGECVDVNKDHVCDYGCGKSDFGEHSDSDTDGDHLCDYCGKEDTVNFKPHVDENKDHVCDNGCSVAIGDHEDADKDHVCDYGCSVKIGDHEDANKDHACDYGCTDKIGEHEDANKDHACDYGCTETIGEHEDEDKDHVCDYGCDEQIGECADANKDHACDYGCDKVFGTHADADKNHVCDYGCTVAIGAHEGKYACATVCDWCGAEIEPAKAHTKKNGCDLKCQLCGEDTEQVHTYDNDADPTCNVCGEQRTVAGSAGGNENNANNGAEDPEKQGLSGGAIAGIVIGVVVILGGGGFALFWFVIRKKKTPKTK